MGNLYAKPYHDFNINQKLSLQDFKLLGNQEARVDQVHMHGYSKTKDLILQSSINLMFTSNSLKNIINNAEIVRKNLMSLNCFENISVNIDVSSGSNSTPNGYKVTFNVQELTFASSILHSVARDNEGIVKLGFKLNNISGHANHFKIESSIGNGGTQKYDACISKHIPGSISSCISGHIFKKKSYWNTVHGVFDEWGTLFDLLFLSPYKSHFSQNLQYEGVIRDINMLSKESPFKLREESGFSVKSSIKHITTIDTRDSKVLANEGVFFQMVMEVAGFGGDVKFLRNYFTSQFYSKISKDVVFQGSFGGGVLTDLGTFKKVNMMDRFFLGGPMTLRGFQSRGIGNLNDNVVAGVTSYWVSAVHIYVKPLFGMESNRINEAIRLHLFCNAGNISFFGKDTKSSLERTFKDFRLSTGFGVVARIGNSIRFEFNLCSPLQYSAGDRIVDGFQFGVGANFI
ncbi:sorting and assembly machinery component 50 homolog [Metopolophium dirhodum]|uniref:sorting and assembly machinery component 50 homolog n=1 Tax=Metopolophium dirhodum TaxID=44670 RepID=UPI00298F9E06|nr:sorting and assembly machinery component 50 homolog [Metopolophium dirhodum]